MGSTGPLLSHHPKSSSSSAGERHQSVASQSALPLSCSLPYYCGVVVVRCCCGALGPPLGWLAGRSIAPSLSLVDNGALLVDGWVMVVDGNDGQTVKRCPSLDAGLLPPGRWAPSLPSTRTHVQPMLSHPHTTAAATLTSGWVGVWLVVGLTVRPPSPSLDSAASSSSLLSSYLTLPPLPRP